MATGTKLHQLVLSLSSNEKRHFRLKCSVQSGKRNYILLFDCLERMETYDRDRLLEMLNNNLFSKDLHVTENYLYQRILESLRTYHEKNSVELQIQNQLFNAAILEEKGFYELSYKMLEKAKKSANKLEHKTFLVEIIKRQIRNVMGRKAKRLQATIDELCEELVCESDLLQKESIYFGLNKQSFIRYRQWKRARSTDELAYVEDILQNNLIKKCPDKKSFFAQYLYHNIRNNCYSLLGEHQKACSEMESIVELWERSPFLQQQQQDLYIIQVANLINHKGNLRDYEAVESLLDKLEQIKTKSFNAKAEQFQNFYFQKLSYLLNQFKFKECITLVPAIEKGLETYKSKISPARVLAFCYNITILFFLSEQYDDAIHWLTKINQTQRTSEPRKDIQQFSRILHLAICYKMRSNEVLEDMFRRIYRKASYVESLYAFEQVVLRYFKQLLKVIPDSREEKNLFAAFKTELLELSEEQKNVLGFQEFILWIDGMFPTS